MRKILFSAILLLAFTGTARATSDSFVWKDNVNGFTFSFPDSWGIQTDDEPTTRVRIAGPLNEDLATCRVKAEKDGRLKIYPKHLMTEAVDETLNRDFWEGEVTEHNNAKITDYRAPASLSGKGDATAIKSSFVQSDGSRKVNMYSESIASIYGDTRFVVSCSSKAEQFQKYAPVFATIMGSVDLHDRYHPFATGYYRDFLADPVLVLPRTKPGTIYEKNMFNLQTIHDDQ